MWKIQAILFSIIWSVASAGICAGAVDINSATAEELSAAMKDVGKVKAEAIVKDREKNGPFKSIDDLARVKGVKAATINKNRDLVTVGGAAVPPVAAPAVAAPAKPPMATAPAPKAAQPGAH